MNVFEMIENQQKGLEDTTVFMVGEQLKDICRREPVCAGIVAEDMQNPEMGIADCEKKIREFADGLHKKKGMKAVGVSPQAAEGIIRKFYGLPDAAAAPAAVSETLAAVSETPAAVKASAMLELDDLLGI